MRIVIDIAGDESVVTAPSMPPTGADKETVIASEDVLTVSDHDLDAGAAPIGPAPRPRANVIGPPSDADTAGEAPASILSPTFSPPSSADGTIEAALSTVDSSPAEDGASAGAAPILSS
jgi:hypothetical protein